MSESPSIYRFKFDGWHRANLPMKRLAEYLADLAALFGEVEAVHFDRIEDGSVEVVQLVDPAADALVRGRLASAADTDAPGDVASAYAAINRRLAIDQSIGSLCDAGGVEILQFPGRAAEPDGTIGPFWQDGSFEGVLIRIGGRDDTVPAYLLDGDVVHRCNTNREMARKLAPHLYGPTMRARGRGRWRREANGSWKLMQFNIVGFELLDDSPLAAVVERLREIQGSAWDEVSDPVAELVRLRGSADDSH